MTWASDTFSPSANVHHSFGGERRHQAAKNYAATQTVATFYYSTRAHHRTPIDESAKLFDVITRPVDWANTVLVSRIMM